MVAQRPGPPWGRAGEAGLAAAAAVGGLGAQPWGVASGAGVPGVARPVAIVAPKASGAALVVVPGLRGDDVVAAPALSLDDVVALPFTGRDRVRHPRQAGQPPRACPSPEAASTHWHSANQTSPTVIPPQMKSKHLYYPRVLYTSLFPGTSPGPSQESTRTP